MKSVLRIACSRANLQQVRDFVRDYLSSRPLSDVTVNQVVLAVDEVVANFIIHANGEDESQFLDLQLTFEDHDLNVEITDNGDTIFLPAAPPKPRPARLHPPGPQRRHGHDAGEPPHGPG